MAQPALHQSPHADLVHLNGLTNLGYLYLRGTQVTDAEVDDLQKALFYCKIYNEPGGGMGGPVGWP